MKKLLNWLRNDGSSQVEYGLIIIGTVVAVLAIIYLILNP